MQGREWELHREWYYSGNRDEVTFDNPWVFDVPRDPNLHIAVDEPAVLHSASVQASNGYRSPGHLRPGPTRRSGASADKPHTPSMTRRTLPEVAEHGQSGIAEATSTVVGTRPGQQSSQLVRPHEVFQTAGIGSDRGR
jgi:hypothetical protein